MMIVDKVNLRQSEMAFTKVFGLAFTFTAGSLALAASLAFRSPHSLHFLFMKRLRRSLERASNLAASYEFKET